MAQAQKIQIKNISINEFAIVRPQEEIKQGQSFNFDIKFNHSIVIEQSLVNVLTTVSVFGNDKNKIFSRLQTACAFQINQPEFATQNKEGKLTLDKSIAADINTIALSTTRGVLFSQLKGTYLHNAVLPVVNMNIS
jgi:hypothetical protein